MAIRWDSQPDKRLLRLVHDVGRVDAVVGESDGSIAVQIKV
ncbi:MAG TPA: hypothetical protein VK638_20530 [Edaphobacter sp.]|nr:hypothetical protein [Edaphobacter sp.]